MIKGSLFIIVFSLSVQLKAVPHFEFSSIDQNQAWTKLRATKAKSLDFMLMALKSSTTGKKLLDLAESKARKEGTTLKELITVAEGSLTDTTLVRRFSKHRPDDIHYIYKTKVYLNRNLNFYEGTLDLAHELTHYVRRSSFNPYQTPSNLREFVTQTVEGRGGEVEAFLMECQISGELFSHHYKSFRCEKFKTLKGQAKRSAVTKEFYKLGDYWSKFINETRDIGFKGTDFPWASDKESLFVSSAYGVPYPLAATREYLNLMKNTCTNEQRRISLVSADSGRQPASSSQEKLLKICQDL